MSVRYKLVLRKDLSKDAVAGTKKYYVSVNSNGTLGFKEMCEEISGLSTASRGDVMVVMDGLLYCMKRALLRGEIVQLGELGNFQVNTGSKGTATVEDFKASLIYKPRIVFRPGTLLKDTLGKVSFERIITPVVTPENPGGDDRPEEI